MFPFPGDHNTGSYSQHSFQDDGFFSAHGTGAIASTDFDVMSAGLAAAGYYEQPLEGFQDIGQPTYDLLEQNPYQDGVTAATQLSPPLEFGGLRLERALREEVQDLPNFDRPAFPAFVTLRQKMSVRMHLKDHLPFNHQATVLRANHVGPTMGQLATVIAREVHRFLEFEKKIGNPVRHLGRELSLDDLVLVQVCHVSRGSIQPVLGVLRR